MPNQYTPPDPYAAALAKRRAERPDLTPPQPTPTTLPKGYAAPDSYAASIAQLRSLNL